MSSSRRVGVLAALGLAATAVSPLVLASPVHANPGGTALVISEVYGAGGNNGAVYNADFVELYNPTAAALPLSGLAIHYRSAAGGSGGAPYALSGSVPAHGHWLIQMSAAGSNGSALPAPDATALPAFNMAAAGGQVVLQQGTTVIATSGNVVGTAGIVDFVGASGAASYETASTTSAATATQSLNRSATGGDTDNNSADFSLAAPSPANSGTSGGGDEDPPTPVDATIAEVQGPGATSPLAGSTVTTTGVVTADYDHGGFNGIYIQDPEGNPGDSSSDAVFVFGSNVPASVAIGDRVTVTGAVSEFSGTTEITPAAGGVTNHGPAAQAITPLSVPWTALDTEAEKEAHEGELVLPTGDFTVSDNYDANFYGSFVLASGDKPLVTPTEVADDKDTAGLNAVKADNAARMITLDDGSSTNYNSNANKGTPLPWLTPTNPVRVGSRVTFHQPLVLEYRFSAWNLQPTQQVTDDGHAVATFSDTRADNLAPRNVGGDVRLATFNVLNYFPTTGEEYVASGQGTCTYFRDRAGTPIGDDECESAPDAGDGPRGAATAESLARQQVKIVKAINGLGASVVSLEELENSVWFGKDRDFAISTLVAALNAQAGAGTWAYAPSPAAADLPPLAQQDVIRTGFIYKPADVSLVGGSHVLKDQSGPGQAFDNAREPLAQGFKRTGAPDSDAFLVIVNHFKSKGSGVDDGTGQGNANPDRVAQAHALVAFADAQKTALDTDKVFFTGDFNAYSMEDPVQVIEAAGYHELNSEFNNGEATYSFDGMDGSLDHVFASTAAKAWVTGVDVWQINAQEQVGFEYSRYNYNATILYQDDVFRASDHNPEIVGLDLPELAPVYPAWNKSTVYTGGETVTYGGKVWTATWWTQNQKPGDPYGPWQEIATAPDGTIIWTASRIFTGGERVLYQGHYYRAKWWTRNQKPGDPWGPWQPLG
jgi:predicted extracellular nuclease